MKNNITATAGTTINAPVSEVWEALINPDIIKQYFFGTQAESEWKVGSPIFFRGEWQGKKYEDKGTILEIDPLKTLRYSYWSPMSGIEDKPENYIEVTYALFDKEDATTLNIIQDNVPNEEMKEHSEGNWNKVLDNLKKLLEGVNA